MDPADQRIRSRPAALSPDSLLCGLRRTESPGACSVAAATPFSSSLMGQRHTLVRPRPICSSWTSPPPVRCWRMSPECSISCLRAKSETPQGTCGPGSGRRRTSHPIRMTLRLFARNIEHCWSSILGVRWCVGDSSYPAAPSADLPGRTARVLRRRRTLPVRCLTLVMIGGPAPQAIPEPATAGLLGAAFGTLSWVLARRRNR